VSTAPTPIPTDNAALTASKSPDDIKESFAPYLAGLDAPYWTGWLQSHPTSQIHPLRECPQHTF
jgi:hypothetical protein